MVISATWFPGTSVMLASSCAVRWKSGSLTAGGPPGSPTARTRRTGVPRVV
ncbi:MAG TPA: hypothetical protein VFS05_03265 [Gemmatimonadaceae bacterium]|nr:hypothetical protein [Gemmatimonadaceae bacterium]